jgi:hypothetical protein
MKKIQTRAAIVALIVILAALALGGWASSGSGQATPSPSSQPSASTDASASPSESPSGVASPSTSGESYLLTVTVSGADNAIVRSTPVGIDCPSVCSARFPSGTVVTLVPMASESTGGFETRFNGFSGACTGTTCTVTLNQSATVAATFALVPEFATLTVVKSGTGAGGLFISSALPPDASTGINCGNTCSASFQIGTTVTLYPVVPADETTTFVGWSGGCTGTGLCVVTITGPVTVTATYTSP